MKFKSRVSRLFKSDFNKNFLTLFSGSAFAQIIPLLASIFLARIYSPEDFGVLAIFTSIVLIFTSIVNLRYEFAIPLAKNDQEAVATTLLAGLSAILFSCVLFILILLFKDYFLKLIGGEKLGNWIYLIPISLFFNGFYNCLNYFSLRLKKYKSIATSNIVKSGSNAGLQLFMGYVGFKHSGLILGYIFSLLFGNFRMFKTFWTYRFLLKHITKRDLFEVAIRFKRFPLISIWGIFLNNLSVNSNNFFISRFFGVTQLGFYSYSFKYLNAPLSLISTNMGQLFYQVCSERQQQMRNVRKEFISTLKKLLIICVPFFVILYFTIEDLFVLVFGSKWELAGYYCQILLPLFLVRTIFGPLSLVNTAFEKQVLALIMQSVIFLANIFSFFVAYYYNLSMSSFLQFYTITGVVVYIILIYISYLVSKRKI